MTLFSRRFGRAECKKMTKSLMKSRGRRTGLGGWAVALAGMLGLSFGPAQAQSVAPNPAPAEWMDYAHKVSDAVSIWLEEEDGPALVVRRYLGMARTEALAEPEPLTLKVWIDARGRVERLDFAPFADAEVNQAVRDALLGRTLAAAPPKDMIQPLRIAVQPGE
jgi:hypothetical protein